MIIGASYNGITPRQLYEMTVCEYNAFAEGAEMKRKNESVNCILTGYYTAYYVNGGSKARKPQELIELLRHGGNANADNIEEIDKIKALYGEK